MLVLIFGPAVLAAAVLVLVVVRCCLSVADRVSVQVGDIDEQVRTWQRAHDHQVAELHRRLEGIERMATRSAEQGFALSGGLTARRQATKSVIDKRGTSASLRSRCCGRGRPISIVLWLSRAGTRKGMWEMVRARWHALGVLFLLVVPIAACGGAGGGGGGGVCTVYADNAHKSTHQNTRINAVGRVECTYNPSVGPDIDVRLRKRTSSGSWTTMSTSTAVLGSGNDWIRVSESMPCQSGTYRTEARGYSSGPNGQAATWSLWSVGFTKTISCSSSAAFDGSSSGNYLEALFGSSVVVRNSVGDPTWTFSFGGGEQPPSILFDVDGSGNVTVHPESLVVPDQEICLDHDEDGDSECLVLRLHGAGSPVVATIDETAGIVSTPMMLVVDIDANDPAEFPGLGVDCRLEPPSGILEGNDYDPELGTVTLNEAGLTLAPTSSCGDLNSLVNDTLGLPGTVDVTVNAAVTYVAAD